MRIWLDRCRWEKNKFCRKPFSSYFFYLDLVLLFYRKRWIVYFGKSFIVSFFVFPQAEDWKRRRSSSGGGAGQQTQEVTIQLIEKYGIYFLIYTFTEPVSLIAFFNCVAHLNPVRIHKFQCCGAGAGRSRTFLLELKPEPVKKFRLRAVAVWLRGTVVAK